MTKRRDRNRTARRCKRVYCFYWTHEEEHAVARIIAAQILQEALTERTPNARAYPMANPQHTH